MTKLAQSGRYTLSILGALLSLGAPLGWLAICWALGIAPTAVIADEPLLMLYLLVPTMAVFVIVGFLLGVQWERLCEVNDKLNELATRDALTGLLNTRSFWQDVTKECARARRHGNKLHILVIDLDHFKQVNDTYGHLVGDELLKAVAGAMAEEIRDGEELYRVGGEEFSALLLDVDGEQARGVAERLRKAVAAVRLPVPRPAGSSGIERVEELDVTVSIGAAGLNSPQPQELYDLADQALYTAKEKGRNRVVLASPDNEVEALPA